MLLTSLTLFTGTVLYCTNKRFGANKQSIKQQQTDSDCRLIMLLVINLGYKNYVQLSNAHLIFGNGW
jgi:hypothetical protein